MKAAIDYIQEENKKLQRGEKSKGWVEIIEQAQKDAYNQAIEDAAKNAKIIKVGNCGGYLDASVDKQSILKLKKNEQNSRKHACSNSGRGSKRNSL